MLDGLQEGDARDGESVVVELSRLTCAETRSCVEAMVCLSVSDRLLLGQMGCLKSRTRSGFLFSASSSLVAF